MPITTGDRNEGKMQHKKVAGYHPSNNEGARKNDLKEQGFYHWPAWRRARKLALQRDHYLCQECLRQKKCSQATEVHHLQPIADRPDLALVLENLESLCWDCHEATKHRASETKPVSAARIIKI